MDDTNTEPLKAALFCDAELETLLKELLRLAPSGRWFDQEFHGLMMDDVATYDAWVGAACVLGSLDKEDILAVRERWNDRYGMFVDVLDFLLIDALNYAQQRAKEALKALKEVVNHDTTH